MSLRGDSAQTSDDRLEFLGSAASGNLGRRTPTPAVASRAHREGELVWLLKDS